MKAIALDVVNRRGEHAVQVRCHGLAEARMKIRQNFRVGIAAADYAVLLPLRAQLWVVVDRTVEGYDPTPFCACHRLRARVRQIDEGEPAVAKADSTVAVIHSPLPFGPRAAIWSRVRSTASASFALAAQW